MRLTLLVVLAAVVTACGEADDMSLNVQQNQSEPKNSNHSSTTLSGQMPENCGSLLQPDITRLENNVSLQLAYLRTVSEESYRQSSTQASASAILKGLPIGASWADFQEARRQYYEQVGLLASYDYSSSYLTSGLSEDVTSAYVECVRIRSNVPLIAYVSGADPSTIAIRVLRRTSTETTDTARATLIAEVRGGTPARSRIVISGGAETSLLFDRQNRRPMIVNLRLVSGSHHIAAETIRIPPFLIRRIKDVSTISASSQPVMCGGYGNRESTHSAWVDLVPPAHRQFFDLQRVAITGTPHHGGDCRAGPRARYEVSQSAQRIRFRGICDVLDAECQGTTRATVTAPVVEYEFLGADDLRHIGPGFSAESIGAALRR